MESRLYGQLQEAWELGETEACESARTPRARNSINVLKTLNLKLPKLFRISPSGN